MRQATLEKLDQALGKIDRPGSFCVRGSVPVVLPGLEVADLGAVGMPLTSAQAQELIQLCHQAPHGKGEKTIVDTSVRRVWRMEPDRFTLTNPDWERFLKKVTRTVQTELGLERQKLQCHLYDLLLYEPGSFFLPHRDGEKLDRMVATLVVVLPSSFEGGELVVRHDGQEQIIDFKSGPGSSFQIHYAAFYADCEHEVRPLREGYRLCLVYNLTLAKSKKPILAPRDSEHIETLVPLLRQWAQDQSSRKLVITLDHQYTQDGLAWDALKGVDRARAKVLREAAAQAGCKAHLALLTLWEVGEAEDLGGRGYGRRRHWDDDEEEDGAGNYLMGEILDSSLSADHWIDSEGNPLTLGELTVDEAELLNPESLRDVDPEEEFEGYTGNAGMTLDRWYRHGAIILWPEARHFEILCDHDGGKVLPLLKQMLTQWRQASDTNADTLKNQCLVCAAAILTAWGSTFSSPHKAEKSELLEILEELDDPGLIARFLGEVMVKDVSADPGKSLPKLCARYGWATFQSPLVTVMKSTNLSTVHRNLRLLEEICLAITNEQSWIELSRALGKDLFQAIERIDREHPINDRRMQNLNRLELLTVLVRSTLATEQFELLGTIVSHVLASPQKYPLIHLQIPALVQLRPWLEKHVKKPCKELSQWLAWCREKLETRTAQAPQKPTDFRRPAAIPCKCQDCQELTGFLENPRAEEYRFRVRQNRRIHLEEVISKHRCDVDCRTDRSRSPHTLVCTKNTSSYQEKLRTYQEDQQHLATVLSIQTALVK